MLGFKGKPNWAKIWVAPTPLKHGGFKMHIRASEEDGEPNKTGLDLFSLLSDELLVRILTKIPSNNQNPCSLVCKRWLKIHGQLVSHIKIHDWAFIESGRLISRFPNLTDVDLVPACIKTPRNSGILITHDLIKTHLSSESTERFIRREDQISAESLDRGLEILSQGCPNLRKLSLIDIQRSFEDSGRSFSTIDSKLSEQNQSAIDTGLSKIASHCSMLQELELHQCSDWSLRAISACRNLQILRLIGFIDGFYDSAISDIGLTILAHGCKRLVRLELSGCEGSYDGICAIGKCCFMLEELTICDHKMDEGWIAGLSFCSNLKTLRLVGCKRIDPNPGPTEHLGFCSALETLQLQHCNVRDKQSMSALFHVCGAVRELVFQDCWGLDNEAFALSSSCSLHHGLQDQYVGASKDKSCQERNKKDKYCLFNKTFEVTNNL
ncbi:F-box protein At5g07670 isoform X2 [Amborella trichopoda]|uniref:F-box protein At5g07670 isoform X2 n=1 Tax=Amborella trichopoda TaxID=13333 RepID=UPI0009C189E5|nr:F-box protein At5g07670 isoform X2 [Amborella trichopoda]|eukprot:XP_020519630.1 F-box protein At5g07670 isoform X2 [Amborella trichopoda]